MNNEIKETKIRLPIYWASYLANGDGSGLEENVKLNNNDLFGEDIVGYSI